jgi:hypothetical protein
MNIATTRRSLHNITLALLLACTAMQTMATPPVPTLTLSPSSIAWNTNTWVDFDLANITPGAAVNLQVYADIDKNRQAGSNDVLLMRFSLKDGVTNSLGAQVVVCDTNGLADGLIRGCVSYHGLTDLAQFWHATGTYLWQASYTNGAAITSAVFTVTQPTSTVWVAGSVQVMTNMAPAAGRPLPGAVVVPDMFSQLQGVMPATWTDTSGNFTLYLPAGMSTNNLSGLMAIKPDFLTVPAMGDGTPLSSYAFGDPLHAGANTLSAPLFLLPAVPGLVPSVSGTVLDSASNKLAGVLLMMQMDDDGSIMGFGMSKPDGTYSIPWPADVGPGFVMSMTPLLNMRGLMGTGESFNSSTSNISGLDLICPVATTLARVLVKKSEGPGGVAGAKVNMYGDMTGAESYSFGTNGMSELCIVGASNASAEISNDSLHLSRRVCPVDELVELTFPSSGLYTDVEFTTYPGYAVSGHVYDPMMKPLPGGGVYAQPDGQNYDRDSRDVNFGGYYELLLNAGDYNVGTWGYNELGYGDQRPTNLITVTSQNVTNLDFILRENAYISGRVLAGGVPLADAWLEASIITIHPEGGWDVQGVAWTRSDSNGWYTLLAPPGTDYGVRAEGPDGSTWLEQYYSNAVDAAHATLVTPVVGMPITNINFNLQPGAIISGRVLANGNPLADASVEASIITIRPEGGWDSQGVAWTGSDSNGWYTLLVPPGVDYAVRAWGPDGTAWLDQYYSNAVDAVSATRVHPALAVSATNINFNLRQGAMISGYVRGNGDPVPDAQVEAGLATPNPGGGWNWVHVAGTQAESNGFYSFMVPPGTGCVVHAWGPDGSGWLEKYYSNATDALSADLVTATVAVPATNINFNLQQGILVSGRVTDLDSHPLTNMPMSVVRKNLDNWDGVANGASGDNGNYAMNVPPGSNYLVWVVGTPQWLEQCHDHVRAWDEATLLTVSGTQPATNIDFALIPAMTIRGRITDATNGPLDGVMVQFGARDGDNWAGRWASWSETNGTYERQMEAGSNHLVQVDDGRFHQVYFRNKLTPATATPVTAGQGVTVSNVDFKLYDPTADSDNDTFPDYIEGYITGTSPFNSNDLLECTGMLCQGGRASVSWSSVIGNLYYVQRTTNLLDPSGWTNLSAVTATGTCTSLVDSNAPPAATYYRLLMQD